MVWHRAVALPASARMLTILAQYQSYSGDDGSFVLQYFDKAKALADWLISRHAASLQHGSSDPRYGIPPGGDDALYPDIPLDTIMHPMTDEVVVKKNELITPEIAASIEALGIDQVFVRSVLTCDTPRGVCAKCC